MRIRNNIVLWKTFHKLIHKFTQSVLHRLSDNHAVFLFDDYCLTWHELINELWNKLHPFSVFVSLPLKLLLQTDDRKVNIIETTKNEADKSETILRGTENEADAIITLPGISGRVYMVINLTVTAGDCWHIRTMSDFNKQKVNI